MFFECHRILSSLFSHSPRVTEPLTVFLHPIRFAHITSAKTSHSQIALSLWAQNCHFQYHLATTSANAHARESRDRKLRERERAFSSSSAKSKTSLNRYELEQNRSERDKSVTGT